MTGAWERIQQAGWGQAELRLNQGCQRVGTSKMDEIKKGAGTDMGGHEWKQRGTTGIVPWDTFFSQ